MPRSGSITFHSSIPSGCWNTAGVSCYIARSQRSRHVTGHPAFAAVFTVETINVHGTLILLLLFIDYQDGIQLGLIHEIKYCKINMILCKRRHLCSPVLAGSPKFTIYNTLSEGLVDSNSPYSYLTPTYVYSYDATSKNL